MRFFGNSSKSVQLSKDLEDQSWIAKQEMMLNLLHMENDLKKKTSPDAPGKILAFQSRQVTHLPEPAAILRLDSSLEVNCTLTRLSDIIIQAKRVVTFFGE